MDTNRIKRFATEARNILKAGIAAKIMSLGFDNKGEVAEENKPQLMQGGSVWNGQLQTEGFYHQWMALYGRIQQIGIKDVYEEAAYTWFNRLCAIRILQKNGLCQPVLAYADAARTPVIVDEARQGHLPPMQEDARLRLMEFLDDDTKVTEQFGVLITAWCHDNPIIQQCFGGIADYTELLLPNNILAEGGFVDLLNHTEFISDEDFQSPELIGWLYQFYISERKDEVFAKKGKFEADEIPAATQIFTPNWIVKYMVQNTVGRIYLDNNPYEMQLQKKWQYLVEPTEEASNESVLKYNELTDLKVADLACGSGHILNECFDLLYELYIAEGYSRTETIENIFRHNLTGIDLDTRAKQLATFALLLKACQKDSTFADAHCIPNVLCMPKAWDEERYGNIDEFLDYFFHEQLTKEGVEEIKNAFELLKDADSLGSIMKFNLSDTTRLAIKQALDYWAWETLRREQVVVYRPAFELMYALTEKYHALVMNPPYMGGGKMNNVLSKYVKDNYENGKADLATVFVEMMGQRTSANGRYAFIIPPSWMFLSTFEGLRKSIIENQSIESLLHLSRGAFGADFGASSAVIKNANNDEAHGTYFRLVERTFQEFEQSHLRMLFEQTLSNHDFKFRFKDYTKDATELPYSEDGNRIYYPNVEQKNFEKIPGCPIGYNLSDKFLSLFSNVTNLDVDGNTFRIGLMTGDNRRFLRLWSEVANTNIYFNCTSEEESISSPKVWYPINSGGCYRKWYGNQTTIANWLHNGEEMKADAVVRNNGSHWSRYIVGVDKYYQEGISWNAISSGKICLRSYDKGFLIGHSSVCGFCNDNKYVMAFLNTPVAVSLLQILSPTVNYGSTQVNKLPIVYSNVERIDEIVEQNIFLSKLDWNSHETSWDFRRNPLWEQQLDTILFEMQERGVMSEDATIDDIGPFHLPDLMQPLEVLVENYKAEWEDHFMQLHRNEEELNRQFISIYGLEDELTPDVPLDEITILQQGEITIADNKMQWHDDVIIKQFISYAVGCMLGRYRLDKPGLHIAHPNPTDEETAPYTVNGEQWEIDDDGIMPLMPNDCGFSDNASVRFSDFLRVALGSERLVTNLNYVEQCLGKPIEQYFVKDFWKDHKKMYQNRPIYWLFASKKGAFQVIAYMHRMNAYTVERIRAKYLLPFIEHLEAEIDKLDMRRAELSTKETKQLQQLQKQLDECREYHERLQVVAEQAISFDLDDGVIVNYAKFGDVVQKIK